MWLAAQWPPLVGDPALIPFLTEHLSKKQQHCLAEAGSGTIYEMEGFLADGTSNQAVLENFTVLSSRTLGVEQVQALREILNDSSAYNHTRALKQCFFLPSMGLQVTDEIGSMNILLSFSCDLIRFYESGAYSQFHLNPQDQRLETFFKELIFMYPDEGQLKEEYEPMIIPYTPINHREKKQ